MVFVYGAATLLMRPMAASGRLRLSLALAVANHNARHARLVDYFDFHLSKSPLFLFFTATRSMALRDRGL